MAMSRSRLAIGNWYSSLALKIVISLHLLLQSSIHTNADSQAASATPSRHIHLLPSGGLHRHFPPRRRRRFNADQLTPLHTSRDASSAPGYCEILERLRGGGAFLGGNRNNASDGAATSTSLSKRQSQEPATCDSRSRSRVVKVGTASITLIAVLLSIIHGERVKSYLSAVFDREKFRKAIIQKLNNIASKGNKGLLLYTIGFIFWEVCGLPTSVVETAAGMAFGFHKGLLGSFVGKSCGSIVAFILGRTLLSNVVGRKMEDSEPFGLIERGVARNPMMGALIFRYSPFPQLIKNYGLALTKPVTYPVFLLTITIHGFPFSLLWAALGNDSSLRLRASEAGVTLDANIILNGLLIFVTIFGFTISPAVTGWWLAGLRKES